MSRLLLILALATGTAPAQRHHLVACAPGYPGSTEQAQPTMDELAARLAAAAGMAVETFSAEYQDTEATGIERLRDASTTLALLPLPFFLAHEDELQLQPLAQVVRRDGTATERWSLVAARGRVATAGDLDGWQLQTIAGYAPAFVRGAALGSWGALGDAVRIEQPRRLLSALRQAIAGENVALLLDQEQTEALAQLPDADALEIVVTSPPLLGAVVAAVGGRLTADEAERARAAFLAIATEPGSDELMETLRLSAFAAIDTASLQQARDAFRAAR